MKKATMKMLMKLLIILCFLVLISAQTDKDWSFQEMCQFWSGENYKQRVGSGSMRGDTCDFKIPVTTDTADYARRYCEENVPYHINSAKPGNPTICSAEATLICRSGWVQFFGRCYKLTRKMMTRDEAVTHCQEKKKDIGGADVGIAFMHRETLPFRINDYFTNVDAVWMDASEAIARDLDQDFPGGNLLLALNGYKYHLPNVAIARVDPSDKAMALCEYTPDTNLAESHYLLKRYGEIYYPTIFTSDKAYVRSTSSLQRNEANRMSDNDYCERLLRPFLKIVKSQSAIPTEEFLKMLTKQQDATIIRTSVYSGDASKNGRMSSDCTPSKAKNYGIDYASIDGNPFFKSLRDEPIWRTNEPNEECDGASWSTGVSFSRDTDKGLEAMSDARYAPIYCQTNFEMMGYGACPNGWETFIRKDKGQKWCHQFQESLKTYEDAESHCRKMGGHISGFSNGKELDLLDSMLKQANLVRDDQKSVWMGARRREECISLNIGFHSDPNHGCSRLRVFEWVNGVASNPPDIESSNRWIDRIEPNYLPHEKCLELLRGRQYNPGWEHGVDGSKKFNDIHCSKLNYYFCGKEAPVVKIQ